MRNENELRTIYYNVSSADNSQHNDNYIVDELDVYTNYSFKIAAHNEKGLGDFSEPKSATTLEGSKSALTVCVSSI